MRYPNIVYKYGERLFPYKRMKPFTRFIKTNFKDKQLVGCEIGVREGYNARNMLENLNIKKLYLIDPYLDSYDINMSFKDNRCNSVFYDMMIRQLSRFDSWVHIPKESEFAVGDIHDKLDFVYIDGNHNYYFVKKDIELYFPLVKRGGVFGGHDYLLWNGVHQAVSEFVSDNGFEIMGWCHDWWVIKK